MKFTRPLALLAGLSMSLAVLTVDKSGFAPRSFNSFFEAANEVALSRLYGGIHYRTANKKGLEAGQCVGSVVNALHFRR